MDRQRKNAEQERRADWEPEQLLRELVGSGREDEFGTAVLTPLILDLNRARLKKQTRAAKVVRIFVIPMALAGMVTVIGAANGLPEETYGALSGQVFIASAIVLGILGSRKARRKRLRTIADGYGIDYESVSAIESLLLRDAKLMGAIQERLAGIEGFRSSADLESRLPEAMVAALLKADLAELLRPSAKLDEQLKKVRETKHTVESFARSAKFNAVIDAGVAIFRKAEEVLVNRGNMTTLFAKLREKHGHRLSSAAPRQPADMGKRPGAVCASCSRSIQPFSTPPGMWSGTVEELMKLKIEPDHGLVCAVCDAVVCPVCSGKKASELGAQQFVCTQCGARPLKTIYRGTAADLGGQAG
jgi:hypothetical protein